MVAKFGRDYFGCQELLSGKIYNRHIAHAWSIVDQILSGENRTFGGGGGGHMSNVNLAPTSIHLHVRGSIHSMLPLKRIKLLCVRHVHGEPVAPVDG